MLVKTKYFTKSGICICICQFFFVILSRILCAYTHERCKVYSVKCMVNQNTYRRPVSRGWRERWMRRFGMDAATAPLTRGALTVPNWLTGRSIVFFFVAMILCFIAFGYPMEFRDAFIAGLSVVLFFYGGMSMSKSWANVKDRAFAKRIFITGLIVRLIWVFYCYFIFNPDYWGTTYGDAADVEWYMPYGKAIAEWLTGESGITFEELRTKWGGQIDDVGYPLWLAIIHILTDGESDVFVPFLIKTIVSTYCSVCIYHVAKRHFGDGAARMAGLFVALNPNMIYWCGNMFKETEMIFLCCVFIDQTDKAVSSPKGFTIQSLLPGLLAGFSLFFFRAALGAVAFAAMFAHVVMASQRVMSFGKKIIAGVLVAVTLLVGMGDSLRVQTQSIVNTAQSDYQQRNMEWRSTRKDGGNSFAKYAGKAVFAPLIFTIPFPSFNVAEQSQVLQRQLSGGSYIKNILSFFVIMMMFMMLISGEWRRHVFILAYTVGYHVVLALSPFAQSGRFHMPVIPMLMLFGAYGIQIAKTNGKLKRWFPIVLVLEVVICLGWNWFKLAGRGMI